MLKGFEFIEFLTTFIQTFERGKDSLAFCEQLIQLVNKSFSVNHFKISQKRLKINLKLLRMERLRIDLSKHSERSAIIYLKSDKTIQEIKYDQLHIESSKVALVLNDSPIQASASIGILCGRNPTSIALLLGIIEAGCGFCFISTSEVSDDLHKLGIKQFFSDEIFDDYADLRNSLEVFGRKIYLYTTRCTKEIQLFQDLNDSTNRICYTGKQVIVTLF